MMIAQVARLRRKAGQRARGMAEGVDGQQQPAVRVPIYMRDGGAFKPPSSTDKPWIMVGPGTGGPRGWGCLACLARAVAPAR